MKIAVAFSIVLAATAVSAAAETASPLDALSLSPSPANNRPRSKK